jgi:hypothetical protein
MFRSTPHQTVKETRGITTRLPDGAVETLFFNVPMDRCMHSARLQSLAFYPCDNEVFYPVLMCEACGYCRMLMAVPGTTNALQVVDCINSNEVTMMQPIGGN